MGAAGYLERWRLALAVPTGMLGVLLAWALASPASPQPTALVRALAVGLGAVAIGLAVLPRLTPNRASSVPGWRTLAVVATVWSACEAALLVLSAADVENRGAGELDLEGLLEFVRDVNSGRVDAMVLALTLTVAVYAAVRFRAAAAGYVGYAARAASVGYADVALVLAAVALVLRPITGHMSQQLFGSVLAAAHTLAAALWFGLLVAIALTARTRRDWAELLPPYSVWALRCVIVLVVTGTINALVRLGGIGDLFDTGYGRIVFAKFFALAGLVALGLWWRRVWVIPAGAHRTAAEVSLRRAIIEVCATAAVFGLAAVLAVTA